MPQYQMPRPVLPIGGASAAPVVPLVHRTIEATTAARYAGPQAQRFLASPPPRLDGAPVHESYLFAIGQPQARRQIQLPRAKAPIDVVTAPVTQTDVFVSPQPDQARFAARQAMRYVVGAPARLHEGAAALAPQTYLFAIAQPELRAWLKVDINRVPHGRTPQLTGATSQPSFLFPVPQPEPRYYVRNTFAATHTPILGITIAPVVPATALGHRRGDDPTPGLAPGLARRSEPITPGGGGRRSGV